MKHTLPASYADRNAGPERSHWRRYQPHFPPAWRIGDDDPIDEEHVAWRSLSVHVDHHRANGTPRATVILVHGAGGYGRLFAPVGRFMASLGCEVLAPDLPGYGLTAAPSALADYDAWTALLLHLVEREHARSARPILLFGMSIGGWLAHLCAARSPQVAGLVATTLADPREPRVRRELARNRLLLHAGLPLLQALPGPLTRLRLPIRWFTRMERMSRQPELNALVRNDRLGGGNHVPMRLLRSLFSATPALEPERFDRCPVLLAHPALDSWTSVDASRLAFDRLRCDKRLVLLDGCGHFPVEQPGVTQLQHALARFVADIVARQMADPMRSEDASHPA